MLQQFPADWTFTGDDLFRTLSDYEPDWQIIEDNDEDQYPNPGPEFCSDGMDNDEDLTIDEADECLIVHAGWYVDLPAQGERVIKDVIIRDGKAIFLSAIPNHSPCYVYFSSRDVVFKCTFFSFYSVNRSVINEISVA